MLSNPASTFPPKCQGGQSWPRSVHWIGWKGDNLTLTSAVPNRGISIAVHHSFISARDWDESNRRLLPQSFRPLSFCVRSSRTKASNVEAQSGVLGCRMRYGNENPRQAHAGRHSSSHIANNLCSKKGLDTLRAAQDREQRLLCDWARVSLCLYLWVDVPYGTCFSLNLGRVDFPAPSGHTPFPRPPSSTR